MSSLYSMYVISGRHQTLKFYKTTYAAVIAIFIRSRQPRRQSNICIITQLMDFLSS